MVESTVVMTRKDYIKICKELEEINTDLNMYEREDNKELIETNIRQRGDVGGSSKKVTIALVIQIILMTKVKMFQKQKKYLQSNWV